MQRITKTDARNQFAAMIRAAKLAGVTDTDNVRMQEGNATNGIAWRVYVLTPPSTGHGEWPYAEFQGYLGMTAKEATHTLSVMRHVFDGIAAQNRKA